MESHLIAITTDEKCDHWCLECKSEIGGECSLPTNFTKLEKICASSDHTDDQHGCFTWKNGNSIELFGVILNVLLLYRLIDYQSFYTKYVITALLSIIYNTNKVN